MDLTIIKSSGQPEKFRRDKLYESLVRSGAPAEIAHELVAQVENKLTPYMHSKDIYRMARKLLRKYNRASGMRYSLKKALFALGPSGYPFEKYFARILHSYGYSVEVGQTIAGHCVEHEVDVVARKDDKYYIIECKYHGSGGKATDVKVALYIHSRFLDVRKSYKSMREHSSHLFQGWLVTNTRCTTDAVKYAECVGLKIVSWRYPKKGSLEKMIEDKRLYPVTILPSARKKPVEALFRKDIVLAQDIADMDERSFLKISGLDAGTAKSLKQQADELCPCIR